MLVDEWIKKLVYIHNRILFCHKINEILSFAAMYTELQVILLSKRRPKFTSVCSHS